MAGLRVGWGLTCKVAWTWNSSKPEVFMRSSDMWTWMFSSAALMKGPGEPVVGSWWWLSLGERHWPQLGSRGGEGEAEIHFRGWMAGGRYSQWTSGSCPERWWGGRPGCISSSREPLRREKRTRKSSSCRVQGMRRADQTASFECVMSRCSLGRFPVTLPKPA